MFATDPLVRQRRDLPRQPIERCHIQRRHVDPLDSTAQRLDPDLLRTIDVDVGDVGACEHVPERR